MLRERETKRFMGNSCLCQPKPKSTIKQFIQVDSSPSYSLNKQQRQDTYNHRNSRIIQLIDASNRNIASLSSSGSSKSIPITVKYPVSNKSINQAPTTPNYQPFPHLENPYDEINPVDEETTTYDHLRSYMPPNSVYLRNSSANRHQFLPNKNIHGSANQISLHYQNTPPPPPSIQKLPKISRQQQQKLNASTYSRHVSPTKRLNKSISSIINHNTNSNDYPPSERSYLFEKWTTDNNSSGYNSSQDLSNHTGSSSSSIISYCSISDAKVLNDRTNFIDSGFSTLNVEEEVYNYDATENLSNYSNISPSSASSFNGSYHDTSSDHYSQLQQHFPSPFPKIKTCMVAQIKKVKPTKSLHTTKDQQSAYENMQNSSMLEKSYSVNDVLFSLKKMELNNINNNDSGYVNCNTSQAQFCSPKDISSRVYSTTSTPSYYQQERKKSNQRDLDDYLCDEEVEFILSPRNTNVDALQYQQQQTKPFSAMYKFNNKNIAIWEQLV